MKKIESIVKGVSEAVKASFKVKRINKAVESAKLNAQEDLEMAKAELDEFPTHVEDYSAEQIVSEISNCIAKIENAEVTLARIDKIEAYLNEEVAD